MSDERYPGLYIHVPFCKSKCPYCDFYSVTSPSGIHKFLLSLTKEMECYQDRFGCFDTLYLGGGTPTSLTDKELTLLMEGIHRCFTFNTEPETTLEANPDDITPERLGHLSSIGVNRISVGVQSLMDNELRFLGRRSSAEQNIRALEWVKSCGAFTLAVDLIYGFPGQTKGTWLKTLEQTLEFEPEHLSCYQMTIEKDTPFGRMKDEGLVKPVPEEEQADLFLLTSEFLEAKGYIHYEISNFARSPETMSRHNRKYWQHVPYLGLGPAAHSFLDGIRWWNFRSLQEYCNALEQAHAPVAGMETLSSEQLRLEALYLGLRTKEGIDAEIITGAPHSEEVQRQLQREGLIRIANGSIVPTIMGFLVADSLPLLFLDPS